LVYKDLLEFWDFYFIQALNALNYINYFRLTLIQWFF